MKIYSTMLEFKTELNMSTILTMVTKIGHQKILIWLTSMMKLNTLNE